VTYQDRILISNTNRAVDQVTKGRKYDKQSAIAEDNMKNRKTKE
jgi:hypothetical protein